MKSRQLSGTSQAPTSSQLSKNGWYLKQLVCHSSDYPRLHKAPTSSQLPKNGWYLRKTGLLQLQLSLTSQSPNEFTIVQERMVFKKTCVLQQQLSLTSQSPDEFTIAQEQMVFKKQMSATAAIILDFTNLQSIHNCPRADGIKKQLARFRSKYPRLHNPPTNSQLPKSGWYLKKNSPLQQQFS